MPEGPDEKRMKLRYAGTCRVCGAALDARVEAIYERATKTVRCVDCSPVGASFRRELAHLHLRTTRRRDFGPADGRSLR